MEEKKQPTTEEAMTELIKAVMELKEKPDDRVMVVQTEGNRTMMFIHL